MRRDAALLSRRSASAILRRATADRPVAMSARTPLRLVHGQRHRRMDPLRNHIEQHMKRPMWSRREIPGLISTRTNDGLDSRSFTTQHGGATAAYTYDALDCPTQVNDPAAARSRAPTTIVSTPRIRRWRDWGPVSSTDVHPRLRQRMHPGYVWIAVALPEMSGFESLLKSTSPLWLVLVTRPD